jgi:hypothetical protein
MATLRKSSSSPRSGVGVLAWTDCRLATAFPTLSVGVGADKRGDRCAEDQHGDEPQVAFAASEGDHQKRPEDGGSDRPEDSAITEASNHLYVADGFISSDGHDKRSTAITEVPQLTASTIRRPWPVRYVGCL